MEHQKRLMPAKLSASKNWLTEAAADKDSWQSKEINVSGYVSHVPSSDVSKGYIASLTSINSDSKRKEVYIL